MQIGELKIKNNKEDINKLVNRLHAASSRIDTWEHMLKKIDS